MKWKYSGKLPFQKAWCHRVGDHVRGNRAPNRSCPFGLRLDRHGWKGILSFWISLGFFDLDKKDKNYFLIVQVDLVLSGSELNWTYFPFNGKMWPFFFGAQFRAYVTSIPKSGLCSCEQKSYKSSQITFHKHILNC